MKGVIGFLLLVCYGCSGLEHSEQENIRRVNAKAEVILRQEEEKFCTITAPKQRVREPYSWEVEQAARNTHEGSNSSKE